VVRGSVVVVFHATPPCAVAAAPTDRRGPAPPLRHPPDRHLV